MTTALVLEYTRTDLSVLNKGMLEQQLQECIAEYDLKLKTLYELEVPREGIDGALGTLRVRYDQILYMLWLHRHYEQDTFVDTTFDFLQQDKIEKENVLLAVVHYHRYDPDLGGSRHFLTWEVHVTTAEGIAERGAILGDPINYAWPIRITTEQELQCHSPSTENWGKIYTNPSYVHTSLHHCNQVRGKVPKPTCWGIAEELKVPYVLSPNWREQVARMQK